MHTIGARSSPGKPAIDRQHPLCHLIPTVIPFHPDAASFAHSPQLYARQGGSLHECLAQTGVVEVDPPPAAMGAHVFPGCVARRHHRNLMGECFRQNEPEILRMGGQDEKVGTAVEGGLGLAVDRPVPGHPSQPEATREGLHFRGVVDLVGARDDQLPLVPGRFDRRPGTEEMWEAFFGVNAAEEEQTPGAARRARRERAWELDTVRHDRNRVAQAETTKVLGLHFGGGAEAGGVSEMRVLEPQTHGLLLPSGSSPRPGVEHAVRGHNIGGAVAAVVAQVGERRVGPEALHIDNVGGEAVQRAREPRCIAERARARGAVGVDLRAPAVGRPGIARVFEAEDVDLSRSHSREAMREMRNGGGEAAGGAGEGGGEKGDQLNVCSEARFISL